MDDSDTDVAMPAVYKVHSAHSLESSVDPPMEEWSSLEILLGDENKKRALYREGLYDPGDGELCAEYITMSVSDVLRHPYYNYPAILDPGIKEALLKPLDVTIYPDDGQALYLAACQETNQVVVRSFYSGLLKRHIDLRYYGINANGFLAMAKALQNNTIVESLNLADNFLNDDACYHMGDMLLTNITITEINLRGCRIGPGGARRLFFNLAKNKTLKVLDLSYNKLGDEGMESLARAVLYGLNVKVLNLSYNDITGKGAGYLEEAFETHNKFTHLDLSWNKLFSVGGYAFFMKLAESECLEVLNLSWNGLSGRGSKALRNIIMCPRLQSLDLSNNKLEGETVTYIIGALNKAKTLETLDLSFNPMTPIDALNLLYKATMPKSPVKTILMENVNVNGAFISLLKKTKKKLDVTYGNVLDTLKTKKPDFREIVLNRIQYVCSVSKKSSGDIALVAQTLQKEDRTQVLSKDLIYDLREGGVFLDEDLVEGLCLAFPAPSKNPKVKILDVNALVDYVKRKWPDRKLPPTPPLIPEPEPEPEPVREPPKKKKGKK